MGVFLFEIESAVAAFSGMFIFLSFQVVDEDLRKQPVMIAVTSVASGVVLLAYSSLCGDQQGFS
jgi:hypothetical protein